MKLIKNSLPPVLGLILLLCMPLLSRAQKKEETRILIVVDCSYSMWGQWEGVVKMDAAKRLINRVIDSLSKESGVMVALRTYGHNAPRSRQDCQDTRLEVGFYQDNTADLRKFVTNLKPNGTTPIAYSLMQSANDFPLTPGRNIIILITDGLEECKGDPCAVSQSLQSKHIILKPFIIGLGLSDEVAAQFDCVGRFYSPQTENDFGEILNQVISQALNNTTLQVKLNDLNGRPTETDVNMTFYTAHNNAPAYDFYHTMSAPGVPDTFTIDPLPKYNIQINTLPPVYARNVTIKPSEHNIITIDAPQGKLELTLTGTSPVQAVIRQDGKSEAVNVQDFNTTQKYLVGKYDMEVLTLPRLHFDNIQIKQGETTRIEIPQAGKLQLESTRIPVGSIYILRNNRMEWVADIDNANGPRKGLFLLQPGHYKVIYRDKTAQESEATSEKEFRITPGAYLTLQLD